jgi:hypothetical protein
LPGCRRFLRKPNHAEAAAQFHALRVSQQQDGNFAYAAFCALAAAR